MKSLTALSQVLNPRVLESEIEEELRFHVELLTQEYLGRNMSLRDAQSRATARFGKLDEIKVKCATIRRRSNPLLRAMKAALILMLLAGALVRAFAAELDVKHLGELMIAIPILAHLLFYVRGLGPITSVRNARARQSLTYRQQ